MNEKLSPQEQATETGLELVYKANQAVDEIHSAEQNVATLRDAAELGAIVPSEVAEKIETNVHQATELHRSLVEAADALIGECTIGEAGVTKTLAGEVTTEKPRQIREMVREQLKTALVAGNEVAAILNVRTMTESEFETLALVQFAEWKTNGVFDYFEKNNLTPNLVATPNTLVDYKAIVKIAEKFGDNQPQKTYIDSAIYAQYSKEELSGLRTGGVLRLSLAPDEFSQELGDATVHAQRQALQELQEAQPELGLHSLNPLETQAYLFARRAASKENGHEGTYVRSIELPEKWCDRWSAVPDAVVYDVGKATLCASIVDDLDGARVAVGKKS